MNPSPFELAVSTFEHARQFRLRIERLAPFPPVNGLISETNTWFRGLLDEESHHARELRIQVWRLRAAVLYGLVDFDNPALKISDLAKNIIAKGAYFPSLRARCERLTERLGELTSATANPKREKVRAELERHAGDGKKVGLIVALARNHLPAFNSDLIEDFQTLGPGVTFIASRRHLLTSTFDHIVVPFGTRQCALNNEILCGYRARRTTVIAYDFEAMTPRRQVRLPCAIAVGSGPQEADEPDEYVPLEEDDMDDSLSGDVFWSGIRQVEGVATAEAATTDTTYLVPARGLLLSNGAHVFLRDDSKAIEISDLIEGQRSLDDFRRRFPRTPVKKLQAGDLIVLRVQGSGPYLVEVADDLMQKDGREGLRESAVDWKPVLEDVLKEHGSRWFLHQLEKRGFPVASHSYIWKWTTDEVVSPRKEALFYEIIAVLDDCGSAFGERDVLKAAKRRWEEMKELKHYHQKAGQQIRSNLLDRLRTIVNSRPDIGSEYELKIPGVSAGTMAIVRIAAVDTEVVSIPYHRTGVVSYSGMGGIS